MREWIATNLGRNMSARAVGKYLFRMGYKRRRGKIKTPPFTEERMARIRQFLVEMDRAYSLEQKGDAVIVYMDESFIHQAHGSAYSYFFTDENGVTHDGFGRTSGKGSRMIMVHAITKHGPLVTRDENGVPIEEGWFTGEKGKAGRGSDSFKMRSTPTAEFLWQAKLAKGDYHAAMTDRMFMDWLAHRLTPAFRAVFGDKKMILVLDNAPYHHGYDPEVRVPESNSKKYNTDLLRKYGAKKITVKRMVHSGDGRTREVDLRFEVPPEGSHFPQARSSNGLSRDEVAKATRVFFKRVHPMKLVERVDAFMQKKGWELIWTPPYMPSFQPIELFWQHGKHYVSFNYATKRTMKDVYVQIREGWYGNPKWTGQEGGWKEANCQRLVRHAIGNMNEWIKNRDKVLSGEIGALVIPSSYDPDDLPQGDAVDDEGVEMEMMREEYAGIEFDDDENEEV